MDEATKQKALFALIAFNATVVLYQLAFNSSPFSFPKLLVGLLIGAAIGGITFGVVHFLQGR